MYKIKGQLKKKNLLNISEARIVSVKPAGRKIKPVTIALPAADRPCPEPAATLHKPKRSPIVFAVMTICVVFLGIAASVYFGLFETGEINISQLTAKNILININSKPEIISTNAATVGDLLQELDIEITNNDYLDKKRNQELTDGMKIWLRLSVPITVQADGKTYQFDSQPITVKKALEKQNIQIASNDIISQPLLSYIYEPTELIVSRVDVRTVTEDEQIPQEETRVEYAYLVAGVETTVSEGSPGINRSTYEVVYSDGEEISRELVSTEKVRDPVNRIIGYGPANSTGTETKATATAADGTKFYYVNSYSVETTAYTWTGNRTATGTWPKVGTIAVDPKTIPLGSKVYVEGYGFAVAEDTGGLIKSFIVDLYMDTEHECLSWGRRSTNIYILE